MNSKRYTFIHIPDKECKFFKDDDVQEFLVKWSMKNVNIQYYSFNQPFQANNEVEFVQSFFSDPAVYSNLTYSELPVGKPAACITFENVSCTILSMEFFNPLLKPENNIVHCDGKSIVRCVEEYIGGFLTGDNLRNVILNEDFECYKLYSESQRTEFIWKLFSHLCLGGALCQVEISVEPYLNVAKKLYKELVSVEKVGDSNEIVVRSTVLQVQLYDKTNSPLVPHQPENPQDFLYLVIDPVNRVVAVLTHCYELFCM